MKFVVTGAVTCTVTRTVDAKSEALAKLIFANQVEQSIYSDRGSNVRVTVMQVTPVAEREAR